MIEKHGRLRLPEFVLIVALAAFALAAILPASGWLLCHQLRMYFLGASMLGFAGERRGEVERVRARERAILDARPDDFPLQLAHQLEAADAPLENDTFLPTLKRTPRGKIADPHVLALLSLRAKFDGNAQLQAAILRYISVKDFTLDRRENSLLMPNGDLISATEPWKLPVEPTAVGALVEDISRRGETLDPANAYFPTMLAAALIAERRDSEAFAALERASRKTRWNDYASEEVLARTALQTALTDDDIGGGGRYITAMKLQVTQGGPRSLARIVSALAAHREMAGDKQGGFALRRSLSHIGALMRTTAPNIQTSLYGIAMTKIAANAVNGAPRSSSPSTGDARSAERDAKFVAYLAQIGHPNEAAWFIGERAAGDRLTVIWKEADSRADPLAMYMRSIIWWVASGLLLKAVSALLLTLLASYGFVALCRLRHLRITPKSAEGGVRFRRRGAYAVAILVLLYGFSCAGLLIEDAAIRRVVDGRLTNEGQFDARQIGADWPGPVPISVVGRSLEGKQ